MILVGEEGDRRERFRRTERISGAGSIAPGEMGQLYVLSEKREQQELLEEDSNLCPHPQAHRARRHSPWQSSQSAQMFHVSTRQTAHITPRERLSPPAERR